MMQHCNSDTKFDCLMTCSRGELEMWNCSSYGRANVFLLRQTAMVRYIQTVIDEDIQQGQQPQLEMLGIRNEYSDREWMSILERR